MLKIMISENPVQPDFQMSESGDITIVLNPTDDLGRVMNSLENDLIKAIAEFLENLWSNSVCPRDFVTVDSHVVISRGGKLLNSKCSQDIQRGSL